MREKLVKLIASKPELLKNLNTSVLQVMRLADYLIANGVIFAEDNNVPCKWISTDERMPEFYMNEDGCLCTHGKIVFRSGLSKTVHIGYCIRRLFVKKDESFCLDYWYDSHGGKWENVSHWMPLPEPPKEGE